MSDDEVGDAQSSPSPNIKSIHSANRTVVAQLRRIADNMERGRVRGVFLVHVDEHDRAELVAMTERYSMAALLGVTELELFRMKYSIINPEKT
jgi:hypothetical protein